MLWVHSTSGKGVLRSPLRVHHTKGGEDELVLEIWLWLDHKGKPESTSFDEPALVKVVPRNDRPLPGEWTAWVDTKTMEISPLREVADDLGGLSWRTCKQMVPRKRLSAQAFVQHNPAHLGNQEIVEKQKHRERQGGAADAEQWV